MAVQKSTSYRSLDLTRMMKFLKKAAIAVGLLIVSLALLGHYLVSSTEREMQNSKIIQEISRLEQEGKHRDIFAMLTKDVQNFRDNESALVIKWLVLRAKQGHIPYLHLAALHAAKNLDFKETSRLYAAAHLMSEADALRCNDASAGQAINILENVMNFDTLHKRLSVETRLREMAKSWALEFEETNKDRSVAIWICSHGVNAFSQKSSYLTVGEWGKGREKVRADFASSFASAKQSG
jgi:hypothetical protein